MLYFGNRRARVYECVQVCVLRIYNAGYRKIPENGVVLSREEYGELKQAKTLLEFREETTKLLEDANIRYAEALELQVNIKERKETAEKIMNEISGDILTISTRDYGSIEVVPLDRISEICESIIKGDKQ